MIKKPSLLLGIMKKCLAQNAIMLGWKLVQ